MQNATEWAAALSERDAEIFLPARGLVSLDWSDGEAAGVEFDYDASSNIDMTLTSADGRWTVRYDDIANCWIEVSD